MGIHSVRDLRDADAAQLRQMVSVVLERTVRELRGISCLSLEEVVPAKQQIMVSRSFGHYAYTEAELASSLSAYTARAAEKLRKQRCVAGALTVYLRTNPFKPETPQYQRNVTIPLAEPTADTVCDSRVLH
jgi:DNA polymerase V